MTSIIGEEFWGKCMEKYDISVVIANGPIVVVIVVLSYIYIYLYWNVFVTLGVANLQILLF